MRLLLFTLALISAFFVSHSFADLTVPEGYPEQYIYPPKSPNSDRELILKCSAGTGGAYTVVANEQACYDSLGFGSGDGWFRHKVTTPPAYPSTSFGTVMWCTSVYNCSEGRFSWSWGEESKSCPPSAFPDYNQPINWPLGTSDTMCAKLKPEPEPEDCPAGYHSKAVSKAMGSDSCMPKECPASGTGEDLYSSKLTGGTPFNGGGMYCNDGCAYSVKSENVTSDQYALGTSQGVACGDKPYDNKKLSDEGNEGQCETNTVDGVSVMFCNNEPAPPTDKDDDANNDPSKGDETEKPKKELENCASDDNACMMRNLIKEQSNNTQVQIESDTKLHNRMVDTATNNTNVIKSTIENFNTSFDIHARGVKSSQTIELAKLDSIISTLKAGNQIAIDKPVGGGSGGSGGSGNGANEGTCVGEGCSENSKYNGECEGALCDEDIVPKLESVDTEITEWFNEKITIPAEITSSFTNMRNFISSNFASFNGTCTPFTLDVSIAGNSKSITVNQHCEPYETYFKPLVEWLLWTLTAMTLFSMFAQVFRSFSRI